MAHRILLVDDESDILEFVGYNLSKEDYEVRTASNGAEALVEAERFHPHLILLDMMMPVMDGLQTCRALRENPATADTRIVFLSALGEDENQLSGFGAGADDYIPKPIKMNLLKSRINAIMRRIDGAAGDAAGAGVAAGSSSAGSDVAAGSKFAGSGVAGSGAADEVAINREHHTVVCNGEEITLPKKEFALFDLLYSSPEKLFTREEIYSRVWGAEVVVGDRTIDVHIRRLRRKIGDKSIVTVKGLGYKFQKKR